MKTIFTILAFPFRLIANNTVQSFRDVKDSEVDVPSKIFGLASLLPIAASIVMFLIAIINFAVTGGFTKEVNMVINDGLLVSVQKIWTVGTAGFFYNPWVCLGVGAILLITSCVAVIDLYRFAATWKKVIFSIILPLINVLAGLIAFSAVSDDNFNFLLNLIGIRGNSDGITIAMLVSLGVGVLLLIGATILLAGYKPFIRCFANTVFYFAAAPLTCLVVENLIGLAVAVVLIISLIIAGFLFLGSFNSSEDEEERDLRRTEREIEYLENEIRKRDDSVKRHYEGEYGYALVDPDSCARDNLDDLNEIQRLRESMI